MIKENKYVMACLKLVREYLKRIMGILAAFAIFIMIADTLNYMYVKVNVSNDMGMSRVLWHNFYESKGKIDNVYIGSSHVYTALDPALLDEINGQYNFNLATSSLRLNGAYYFLVEADRYNSLSNVYLELYYLCNTKDNFNSNEDPINTNYHTNWKNTDYMKNSFNRLEYMLSIAGPDNYIDIFIPFARYRSNLDDWSYIKSRIQEKNDPAYINYEYYRTTPDGEKYAEYTEQGYLSSSNVFTDGDRSFEQDRILEKGSLGGQ